MKKIVLLTILALQCFSGYSQANSGDEELNSLRGKIISLYQNDDIEAAYDNAAKYVSLAKKSKTPTFYPEALSFQAEICIVAGRYKEAQKALDALIGFCDRNVEFYAYARQWVDMQEALYTRMGATDKIPGILCRYIDYSYDNLGMESQELADICRNISVYAEGCRARGEYREAETILTTVTAHLEKRNISPYLPTSILFSGLSIVYSDMGMQEKAIDAIEKAIGIRKEAMGDAYLIDPTFSINLGLAHYKSHNYADAVFYMEQAIESVAAYPDMGPAEIEIMQGSVYASLCAAYMDIGEFAKAEESGLKAIELSGGAASSHSFHAFNNLGRLYQTTGDNKRGLQCFDVVMSLLEESGSKGNVLYIMALQNKGMLLSSLGRYEESANCFIEAIDLINQAGGDAFPDVRAKIANNLGMLCYGMGDIEKARYYWEGALSVMTGWGMEDDPAYLSLLSNLSILNYIDDDMTAAEQLTTQALSYIRKKDVPDNTRNTVIGNSLLVLDELNRKEEAGQLLLEYSAGIERQVLTNWAFMTNSQREIFWNTQALNYSYIYGFIVNSADRDDRLVGQAYNSALFSKGLLLNSSVELDRIILESHDPVVIEKYSALKHAISIQEKTGEDMSSDIERLEKELINTSKTYGDYTRNLKIRWNDVKDELRENDLAVEFVDFGMPDSDRTVYAALILRKDWEAPKMVTLFEKTQLETLTRGGVSKSYHGDVAKQITELIWGPLYEYIDEGDNVYFSPSGMLNLLAIESLPLEDGRTVSEKYNTYRLSTTKQLCYDNSQKNPDRAVLYGGLIYDLDDETMIAQSRAYSENRDEYAMRGFEADSTFRAGWKALPGTKTEVTKISKAMREHGMTAATFGGENGSEESFRALSGQGYNIIHIATHGFFLPLRETRRHSYFNPTSDTPQPDNSMRRSGLMMSGGNKAWCGEPIPEGVEDGVLTSQEIMLMDLRGADLVVLSACETGLGEVSGEGVFGLQRAFKKAGAETIIMSLWKVSDSATEMMMNEFYTHLLAGASKREAFLKAQAAVKAKYDNDPYYWAAFIMLD